MNQKQPAIFCISISFVEIINQYNYADQIKNIITISAFFCSNNISVDFMQQKKSDSSSGT